jgi:hypothetical protein
MLAPVIFISLRSPRCKREHFWCGARLKRLAAPINIYSINFLRGIFFPINFPMTDPDAMDRFSNDSPDFTLKILFAPTL